MANGSGSPRLDELANELGVTLTVRDDPNSLISTASWAATSEGPAAIPGHGSGPDRVSAGTVAVMESLERTCQFGEGLSPVVTVDSATALGDRAINVPDLGLYTEEQYRCWATQLSRFTPTSPVAWVRATRVRDAAQTLVPLETVHPRAVTPAAPLVFETSSGTAAGTSPEGALASALCEAVERDACLLWWYTRPGTARLDLTCTPGICDDLERLAAAGFVVVTRLLPSLTSLPVVMVAVLRGAQVAIGVGCAPDPVEAASHALRELNPRLRWVMDFPDRRVLHFPLALVRTGADHVGLYDRGPLHAQLRWALEETTTDVVRHAGPVPASGTVPDSDQVLSAILGAGLDPIVVDLPVPLSSSPVHVRRVLVPGLVPFWVGAGRERIWSQVSGAEGTRRRLKTLLPHPFG